MSFVHIARNGLVRKGAAPTVSIPVPTAVNRNLLLLGEGTNFQTTFTDSSVNNFTVSRLGDTVIRTDQFPTGMSSSIYFDGVGDALSIANNSQFNWAANNFTIEFWVYYNSADFTGGDQWFRKGNFNLTYYTVVPNSIAIYVSTNGSSWNVTNLSPFNSTGTLIVGMTPSAWNHIALTRQGSTWRGFVNGTLTGSTTADVTVHTNTSALNIGGYGGADSFSGWMSNVSVINGTALYTGNFTPPSLPLSSSFTTDVITNRALYGVRQNK